MLRGIRRAANCSPAIGGGDRTRRVWRDWELPLAFWCDHSGLLASRTPPQPTKQQNVCVIFYACVCYDGAESMDCSALELGSGCGLVAIALALSGYRVIATDKPTVLPLLQRNLESFQARVSTTDEPPQVETCTFEWNTSRPEQLQNIDFDAVVCCDCVYSTAAVEPLLATLRNVRSFDSPPYSFIHPSIHPSIH